MTSDLGLLRLHMARLREQSLKDAHALALEGNPASFTLIACAHARVDLVDRLLRDLKELEVNPGEFVKRYLQQ